jgi:hypothetical protein
MLTMNTFHKLLFASSKTKSPYLKVLSAFTKIGRTRLLGMTDDLGWQAW